MGTAMIQSLALMIEQLLVQATQGIFQELRLIDSSSVLHRAVMNSGFRKDQSQFKVPIPHAVARLLGRYRKAK